MSDKQLLEFKLEDGTPFFFEVEASTQSGPQRSAKGSDKLIAEAKQQFDDAFAIVEPVAKKVIHRLKAGLSQETSEVEVKFGLKLTAEAGVVFAAAGSEVNFEVTLKWKNQP